MTDSYNSGVLAERAEWKQAASQLRLKHPPAHLQKKNKQRKKPQDPHLKKAWLLLFCDTRKKNRIPFCLLLLIVGCLTFNRFGSFKVTKKGGQRICLLSRLHIFEMTKNSLKVSWGGVKQ